MLCSWDLLKVFLPKRSMTYFSFFSFLYAVYVFKMHNQYCHLERLQIAFLQFVHVRIMSLKNILYMFFFLVYF
uniref:Uncharacterized protein n=1 Tax=Anguilla anguilla TaxID=7936 RepID=A0A0E9WP56_ANGAN